ncbi:MAG: hypothetical protein KJ697_01075 [Nanoarchaeota archaeon]|nr:hypothetical protein [Nanoarchaeota archaeon]
MKKYEISENVKIYGFKTLGYASTIFSTVFGISAINDVINGDMYSAYTKAVLVGTGLCIGNELLEKSRSASKKNKMKSVKEKMIEKFKMSNEFKLD